MNLIGPGSVDEHFTDCQRALDGLDLEGHWADLGSGAGFPGLVMGHLFSHLRLVLVESRQKRATFLRHVLWTARAKSEHITVHHGRVEELPSNQFDGVTSRAFAPLPVFVNHANRLLRPGGHLLVFIQRREMDGVLSLLGYETKQVNEYEVAGRVRCSVLLQRADSEP